ncbi:MAG: hypothetical protein M1833_006764 [Piccolia ochrophora]|nr:MAG: hypothetical protein M1833_006764 [Piccolia ochrophora]
MMEFNEAKQWIQAFTRHIKGNPHDPNFWNNRGKWLVRIGYPELAIGDLCRSRLLIDAAKRRGDEVGDLVQLTVAMSVWYESGQIPNSVLMTPYSDEFRRTVERKLNLEEIQSSVTLADALGLVNAFRESFNICLQASVQFPAQRYFAFKKNEIIDLARRQLVSVSLAGRVHRYSFPWLTTAQWRQSESNAATNSGSPVPDVTTATKAIEAVVRENAPNPLTSLAARYIIPTAAYGSDMTCSLQRTEQDLQLLKQLGVDIFTDERYETWVLTLIRQKYADALQ